MADIDTIVFGVFAGYLPTISEKGKGKGAFTTEHKYLPAKGIQGLDIFTKENQGILTDGSLGAVRIRGTRAWYEHSTAMRPLKQEEFKDVFKAAKDMWYRKLFGQGKMFDDEKLIEEFGAQMPAWFNTIGKEIETTGDVKGTPEEMTIMNEKGEKVQWKGPDAEALLGNTVDIYREDVPGEIIRYDVSASGMAKWYDHHGIGPMSTRKDFKGGDVSGKALTELVKTDIPAVRKRLAGYFEEMRTNYWNPPIIDMRNYLVKGGGEVAQTITSLMRPGARGGSLKRMTEQIKKATKGMRMGTTTPGQFSGGKQQAKANWRVVLQKAHQAAGHDYYKAIGITSTQYKEQKLGGVKPSGKKGQKGKARSMPDVLKAQNQGIQWAFHMLSNVVALFSENSKDPGHFSVAYKFGQGKEKGGESQNWMVEVINRVVASGPQVFEFDEIKKKHILLHNERSMTHVYVAEAARRDKLDVETQLVNTSITQNYQFVAEQLRRGVGAIQVGTVYQASWEDYLKTHGLPKVSEGTMAAFQGAGKVLDQTVSEDIDKWIAQIQEKGKETKEAKQFKAFLKSKLKQFKIDRKDETLAGNALDPLATKDYMDRMSTMEKYLVGAGRGNLGTFSGRKNSRQAKGYESNKAMVANMDILGYILKDEKIPNNAYAPYRGTNAKVGIGKKFWSTPSSTDLEENMGYTNSKYQFQRRWGNNAWTKKRLTRGDKVLQQALGLYGDDKEYKNWLKFATSEKEETRGMGTAMMAGMGRIEKAESAGEFVDIPWDAKELPRKRGPKTALPMDFWASPYISLLYPSFEMTVAPRSAANR